MGAPTSKAQVELKKGPWTREEDQKLLAYIQQHGHGSWRNLPAKAGLWRCGKSCRLRWTNYLRPDIKRGKFSTHEEKAIIRLHALLGNRWSAIAAHLPKRTDNEIKNYWNTRLKKRLTRMGIDPVTHKPKNNPAGSAQSRNDAALSHMAQWETARLEAEARLARQSKLMTSIRLFHRSTARPPPPPPPPQHLAATPPLLDVLKVWQTSSIPSCFLTSPGTLESPTSTLNFSSNSLTVPTVSSVMANNVVSMNNNYGACGVGLVDSYPEMENSLQLQDENVVYDPMAYDCDMMMGSVDLAVFNHDSNGYNMFGAGQFEDSKTYWNDLLDLVIPNME